MANKNIPACKKEQKSPGGHARNCVCMLAHEHLGKHKDYFCKHEWNDS